MKNRNCVFVLAGLLLMAGQSIAQSNRSVSSLCDLQRTVPQGEHRTVRVEGVYWSGLENQTLMSPACSDQSTKIEFDLKSHRLWDRLVKMTNKPSGEKHGQNAALVIFEGEFYGPPVPDPKLPDAIRKNYHPGWDYDSKTKLVVHAIQKVKSAPPNSVPGAGAKHEADSAQ